MYYIYYNVEPQIATYPRSYRHRNSAKIGAGLWWSAYYRLCRCTQISADFSRVAQTGAESVFTGPELRFE